MQQSIDAKLEDYKGRTALQLAELYENFNIMNVILYYS